MCIRHFYGFRVLSAYAGHVNHLFVRVVSVEAPRSTRSFELANITLRLNRRKPTPENKPTLPPTIFVVQKWCRQERGERER